MSINAAGLKAEVITGSVRILMAQVMTDNLLDKPESEIRYAEWKWLDTHLAVIEMLVGHLRRRIAPKINIEGEVESLIRENKQDAATPNHQAAPTPSTHKNPTRKRVIRKKPPLTTKTFKKGDVEVSVNLEINRYTMKENNT